MTFQIQILLRSGGEQVVRHKDEYKIPYYDENGAEVRTGATRRQGQLLNS